MKRSIIFYILLLVSLFFLLAPMAHASVSTEAAALAEVLHNNAASGFETPYGSKNFPEESINPIDGSLTLSATDLYLPGKNGLDLVLKRVYNSEYIGSGYCYANTERKFLVQMQAYKYTYTLDNGDSDYRYVAFGSEDQMLRSAPEYFYTFESNLERIREDNYYLEYIEYTKLNAKNGKVKMVRDKNAAPRKLMVTCYAFLTEQLYESPYTAYGAWSYSLPYIFYVSTNDKYDNYYDGYGILVDYNGESHVIRMDYERVKKDGSYVYEGSVTVNDNKYFKGYVESGIYEIDGNSVVCFIKIIDSEGRTMIFGSDGTLRLIIDRFGNYIKYEYENRQLLKITDSLGRTVSFTRNGGAINTITVDADNDGTAEKTITFTDEVVSNNYDLDPQDLLKDDNVQELTVSVSDKEGESVDTVYQYSRAKSFYHEYNDTFVCPSRYTYDILSIIHPNGLRTNYTYSPVRRSLAGYYTTTNMVASRNDEYNGNIYNSVEYSYKESSDYTFTTTETDAFKGIETVYTSTLKSPSHTKEKVTKYDLKTYIEEYTYPSSVSSSNKMLLTKLVSKVRDVGGKYTYTLNTTDYTYQLNRLTKKTRNSVEETRYKYHSSTDIISTKEYAIGKNRWVKEEYELSPKTDNDTFKNRAITSVKTYESTNNCKTYTLMDTAYLTYDQYGNVISRTDSTGTHTYNYIYDNGNTTVEYTSPSLENGAGTAVGTVSTVTTTDCFGNVISSIDGNGNEAVYEYDVLGNLVCVTDPMGNVETYSYDIPNRTTIYTAKNGQKTKVVYDGFGNPETVSKYYNGAYRTAASYTYDEACRPVTATEYLSYSGSSATQKLTTTYTWSNDDMVLTKVTEDQSGNVVEDKSFSYKYAVALAATQQLTPHDKTNNAYHNNYRSITLTQPTKDGITPPTVTEYYDVDDRLVKRVTTDGSDVYYYTAIYDYAGNMLEEKDEYAYLYGNGIDFSRKTEYDYRGNPLNVYDSEGNCTAYEYDEAGRMISETDPMGNTRTYTYDGLGRMLTKTVPVTDSLTSVTQYTYDGNGNLLSSKIPAASRTESYTYDELNRPVTAYDGRYYTKYLYDVMGNVTKSVAGLSSSTTNISGYAPTNASYTVVNYTYDSFGNVLTKTDALGTTTYTYDFSGRQLTAKDPNGITTKNTYTPTGLIKTSTAGNDVITNTYDFWGNLKTTVRTGETKSAYTYDNMFNMVKEVQGSTTKTYTYDGVGMLMNFNLKYGSDQLQNVDYTYDLMGRMSSVSDGITDVSYTYNENGNLVQENRGGMTTDYEYNYAGLVSDMTNIRSSNGVELSKFTNTYKADGNLASQIEARTGGFSQNNRYTYYNNGELSYAYLGSDTYDYTTNNRGNRTSSYVKGSDGIYHRTYNTYTTGNRLSSSYSYDSNDTAARYNVTSYTYDANGNTLTTTVDDVTKTRTYTTRNEVKTFTDGGDSANDASYTYGPDGLRTSKTVNGTKTTYIWSGGNIVAEITSDKTVIYLYGLNRVSRTITGTKYTAPYTEIYVYDTHGNVVQLANENLIDDVKLYYRGTNYNFPQEVDFNGDGCVDLVDLNQFSGKYPISLSYHYDAFGNLLDDEAVYDTNPFRYCGEYWDKETGEIYLRARYYNPRTGRFTTVDPAMDGTNWYVYCSGNPIAFVDPWGLYNRDAAVAYAVKYYLNPNPDYEYFEPKLHHKIANKLFGTGKPYDCANFVSQALVAGGISKNDEWHYYMNNNNWAAGSGNHFTYYDERDMTLTWSVARKQFAYFSDSNNGYINGDVISVKYDNFVMVSSNLDNLNIQKGDLMYFAGPNGDNVHHATIISKVEDGEIYYAAHSNSQNYAPLSEHLSEVVYIVRIKEDAK